MSRTRHYWPRAAWLAFALTGVICGTGIAAGAVLMAAGEFGVVLVVAAVSMLLLLIAVGPVVVRLRPLLDQHVSTDGETFVHACSPLGDIMIQRADVERVELDDHEITIESADASIVIERQIVGFARLREQLRNW